MRSNANGRKPGYSMLLALLMCAAPIAQASDTPPDPLPLIPLPASIARHDGTLQIAAGTPVVFAAAQKDVANVAALFKARVAQERGLTLGDNTRAASGPNIVFKLDPASKFGNEGYRLVIDQQVTISAPTARGLFYGSMTLLQLMTPEGGARGPATVPGLVIEDQPRFRWRGLMLDSVRHFIGTDEIRATIDQMAAHKLNTLHWHLTDDQGWRIEIKRYPKLTSIGAWRTPPDAGKDGEPLRYGGFYTQDEIRAIVAYAAARYITVVPEIDMPGHAQAAVASYPQIGVTGQQPPVSVDWGVNTYLYNVDEPTFTFVQNVLDEVMALFPSRYIHVGGDEAVKDQWEAAPAVQAKIKALGLKDENALQGWFIARLGKYLQAHGRRLIGWDEILEGNVPQSATVMSWRGLKGAVEAAQKGHDVVSAPAPDLYLDYLQSARADEGTGRMPVSDLSNVYHFEPVPQELNAAQQRHVIGAQATLFTEHMPTAAHRQHAIFPRLDALSEVLWSPASTHDWQGFLQRLPAQFSRYRAQDIAYADSTFAVAIDTDRNVALATGTARITLSNQVNDGELHYTLDGSAPTQASPRYVQPFEVKLPNTVRAVALDAQGQALAAVRSRVIDAASLATRVSGELPNCPGSDFRLRVQPMPDATSITPVYNINVFDTCQMYPQARLDGVLSVAVEAVRLERNYALAHEAKLVVSRPATTQHGELVVHQDRCDGPQLASMPLPDPASSPRTFRLQAALPANSGIHDLCLIFTAPTTGPLYGLAQVRLSADRAK